ncbi:ATP-binding protein [Paenibacillus sp. YN15]|uniref:ATP-binding protein n=1 Tax=Paenibacillus sp. YN15 TaxID=1742774 RepID=UPI000DCF57CE|nr:ATP-binding protein [Paenibacillus sp. YN15]RAV02704.1 ATP-binding protein [Paenibacillus sp. YN15]
MRSTTSSMGKMITRVLPGIGEGTGDHILEKRKMKMRRQIVASFWFFRRRNCVRFVEIEINGKCYSTTNRKNYNKEVTLMDYLCGSLFEEDYLLRTLGALANSPDIALTELVANAWDAGASEVSIVIPDELSEELIVTDNGTGLTPDEFKLRWMTLGYNRLKHQGSNVLFPEGNGTGFRRAFGRNGVGRHGMLCFSNEYTVETTHTSGIASKFIVSVTSGQQPFTLKHEQRISGKGHGTVLRAKVERNLPDPKIVRSLLSARFMQDPRFQVTVNGLSIELMQHKGLIESKMIKVNNGVTLEIVVIDSAKTAKTARQHGVAFWVGNRLVGEPSWTLGNYSIDGRTSFAKRHTIVVKTNDLFDAVMPDWSAFRRFPIIDDVYRIVSTHIESLFKTSMKERVQETQRTVLYRHKSELSELHALGRVEVSQFIEQLTEEQPTINHDHLSAAVQAIIQLEKSRSGANLIQKLSMLSEEDVDGLNRLLDDWSVKDALVVLDEIDKRLLVIEALGRFSQDPTTEELKTLHPLVLQARWLFGPEFDSPHYTSNVSLTTAMSKLFQKKVDKDAFFNARNRPDIIILENATFSTVCSEEFEDDSPLSKMKRILIIELKRGGFAIGRDEMDQAGHYVEDLLNSGHLTGVPFINAFVVGHAIDTKVTRIRKVGDNPERGRIEATTFGQLVSTANQRLLRLKEQLDERYKGYTDMTIVQKVLNEPSQIDLFEEIESA